MSAFNAVRGRQDNSDFIAPNIAEFAARQSFDEAFIRSLRIQPDNIGHQPVAFSFQPRFLLLQFADFGL